MTVFEMEYRGDFVKRLRRTVTWMSINARKHGRGLCEKKRAAQVLYTAGRTMQLLSDAKHAQGFIA